MPDSDMNEALGGQVTGLLISMDASKNKQGGTLFGSGYEMNRQCLAGLWKVGLLPVSGKV